MYHALYRKYRPTGFDSVVGQNMIVTTLQNSIKSGLFSHAYMFFGPRGTGKTTISKIFARSINCLDPVDGNACGKCKNCSYSSEKECVDIIEIDAASNNGVDEIRELKNKISLVPAELKYKVYIIDEVHMLSIGAFNALLKTLEEPPKHAIFILATTDPQKVPETITSRCQCFSFKRISVEMLVERLNFVCSEENIEIDNAVLEEIALAAAGGMRDALGMLDKLRSYTKEKITLEDFAELNGMITNKQLLEFCNYVFLFDVSSMLSCINDFNSSGKNIIQIMSQLMYFLRNMLVDYYINNLELQYSIDDILYLINVINEKMFDIKKSDNPKIFVEMLLLKFVHERQHGNKNISREIISDESNSVSFNKNTFINSNDNNNQKQVISEKKFDSSSVSLEERKEDNVVENNNLMETVEVSADSRNVKNIDDIIKVRINNTLALANKQILKEEIDKIKLLKDYTFDQEIGYIACSLLDGNIRAASEENIIISYEYDSVVKQNLSNLDKIIYVYNKITNSNKKIAIISDQEWENVKSIYIKSIKDGKHYTVKQEPEEVLEEVEKDDIIVSSAIELFGDIVEIK